MVILVSFGNQKQLIKFSFAELLCPDHQINSRFDEHLPKKTNKIQTILLNNKTLHCKIGHLHLHAHAALWHCIKLYCEDFGIERWATIGIQNRRTHTNKVREWKWWWWWRFVCAYEMKERFNYVLSCGYEVMNSLQLQLYRQFRIIFNLPRSLSLVQNRAECCSSFLPEFSILIADCGSCQRRVYVRIEISLDRSKCVRKRRGAECYSTRGCSTFIVINNNEESLPFIHTLFAAFDYISWMNAYRFCARWLFHFFWYRVKAHISIQNNANVIKLSKFNEMTLRTHDKLLDDDLLRKSKQFSIFAVHSVCSVFQALNSNARRLY